MVIEDDGADLSAGEINQPIGARQLQLEYEQDGRREIDGLMGWTGSADTQSQVCLKFPGRAEAVAFARKRDLDYNLEEPQARRVRPKSYTANFIRKV
jgi:hypothetical protein